MSCLEENKNVDDFFTRITRMVNQTKMCREEFTSRLIFAKILRTLLPKFYHMLVAIEESKDQSCMKKE